MPLGTNNSTITTSANFIPKLWSNEVLAAYQAKTVLRNLVSKIPFAGKKGDTLHIPVPARSTPNAKAANTQVTLIADTAGVKDIVVNKWYEYSKLYEDMAEMQALASMRAFYTSDAGYALAKQVDQDLHLLGAGFQGGSIAGATNLYEAAFLGGDGSTLFSGSANTNTGNGTALSDAGIRKMIQTLEDQNVDMATCAMVIPPVEAAVLRGTARFTEQAFVGNGQTIETGKIAEIYGLPVYISTNCPWIHVNSVTGTQSVTFTSAAPTGAAFTDAFGLTVDWSTSTPSDTKYRAGMIISKDAAALAEQMGIRTQAQYKQEYLGTLVTSDTIYGVGELRDYAACAFVVPA